MIGGTPQEHGEKIADYPSYPAAQQAVSKLIAEDIPARDIAIVGHGLRSVETITGRLGYAAAARSGWNGAAPASERTCSRSAWAGWRSRTPSTSLAWDRQE